MILTDYEKALLDGREGAARQKAMELLLKYGEAVGAERFVETNNVCCAVNADILFPDRSQCVSVDAAFSEFYLDCSEAMEIPEVKAYTCRLVHVLDPAHWQTQGADPNYYELVMRTELFCARIGMSMMNTCAPYLVGNIPMKGEICAWMESSAVIYCNSVLGGRTNTEGLESSAASMLAGRTPCWGLLVDENRLGTHLVNVEYDVKSAMDWGLLGYYAGEIVQDHVPVFDGIKTLPDLGKIKHFGAAAASSGGVELYHLVGITPEARSMEEAFGKRKPMQTLKFGKAERKVAYDNLTSAKDTDVDFIVLGCPHYSIEQLWSLCKLLEGKRVHCNTNLWIFTPRAIKDVADRQGLTEIISNAGGVLMTDTCPCLGRISPKGTKVAATDSAKQAHYLPVVIGAQTWFGSQEDCVETAITGKWRSELK